MQEERQGGVHGEGEAAREEKTDKAGAVYREKKEVVVADDEGEKIAIPES